MKDGEYVIIWIAAVGIIGGLCGLLAYVLT
jgi:hypothetical protein